MPAAARQLVTTVCRWNGVPERAGRLVLDMTTPWTYSGAIPALSHADGVVTLVESQTFCLSGRGGDFLPGTPHGLFVLDSRVLSRWSSASTVTCWSRWP